MKRILLIIGVLVMALTATAQYDFLTAHRGVIKGGYDFWVYTPEDYYFSQEHTPVVIFLHGASLCGRNINRSRRYGPLDAIVRGREIPALVIVPQNPGGAWNPKKVLDVLEWTRQHYACDSTRVYVLGMSLGGYGTMDFAGTYPDKVAAAMALCGGCSLKDVQPLGELPLWIIHGTADRAVPVSKSKQVVSALQAANNDKRLRYDWWPGANHGAPARIFYSRKTYEWLFSHSLSDKGRPVRRDITITQSELKGVYNDMPRDVPKPEEIEWDKEEEQSE
jgi:predicted peptidase